LDRQTGEPVALKLILHQSDAYVARFHREARVLAELRHPGIARHVAHGATEDGRHYLAMEWLEGEDLAARLARGPLGIEESLALAGRVAEALAVVHARRLVHRDVKPANLLLVGDRLEQVKVIDFGIVRVADATCGLTEPGMFIGTPAYMAPEQVRSEPDIDARADVYALGCLLFECLTARPPFVAERLVAVLAKIVLEEPPRPSELRPGVPAWVISSRWIGVHASDRSPHPFRLCLQNRRIVDSSSLHTNHGPYSPLPLLHRMPGLVREVPLLSRREVNLGALRVGQCTELRGLRRVVMDSDVVQRQARELLQPDLQWKG
jgi:serine/threonine protein kinase